MLRHLINSVDLTTDRIKTNSIKSKRSTTKKLTADEVKTKDLTITDEDGNLLWTDNSNDVIKFKNVEILGTLTTANGVLSDFTSTSDNLIELNQDGGSTSNDVGWFAPSLTTTAGPAFYYDRSANTFRLISVLDQTTKPLATIDSSNISAYGNLKLGHIECRDITLDDDEITGVDLLAVDKIGINRSSVAGDATRIHIVKEARNPSQYDPNSVIIVETDNSDVNALTLIGTSTSANYLNHASWGHESDRFIASIGYSFSLQKMRFYLNNATEMTLGPNGLDIEDDLITGGNIICGGGIRGGDGDLRIYSDTNSTNSNGWLELTASGTMLAGNGISFRPNSTNATGGSNRLTLLPSGQLLAENGSASVPTYSFDDDANSGLYSSSNNVIGISTEGNERVTISSDLMQVKTDFGVDGDIEIETGNLKIADGYRERDYFYINSQIQLTNTSVTDPLFNLLTTVSPSGFTAVHSTDIDTGGTGGVGVSYSASNGNISITKTSQYSISIMCPLFLDNVSTVSTPELRFYDTTATNTILHQVQGAQINSDNNGAAIVLQFIRELNSSKTYTIGLSLGYISYDSNQQDAQLSVMIREL